MPKVSIVIPFYNCPYIDRAIESALAQTYKDIEVIVIDDGSSLHTEKISPYNNHIKYIKKENGGTGSALNAGIRESSGNYFSWLSSDDLFSEQKIEMQLEFMEKETAEISYTNYYVLANKNKYLSNNVINTRLDLLNCFRSENPINGCTIMMAMNVFSKVGYFNESLKCTQDYDFWLRAIELYDFHYLHQPLVTYRVHKQLTPERNKQLAKEILSLNKAYDSYLIHLIKLEEEKNKDSF